MNTLVCLMNRKVIILFGMMIMGTVFLAGFEYRQASDEQKQVELYRVAEALFKKGEVKFHKGNYAEAEKYMQKCIKTFPMHAHGHYYLSLINYIKSEYNLALEHIEKAETSVLSLTKLKAQLEEERKRKLKEYQVDLRDGKYVSYFGENNPCMEKYGENVSNLEAMKVEEVLMGSEKTDIAIPAAYFYSHGNIFYKLKRYREALSQYVEVIRRDPKHGNAYNNMANLFYMAGKKEMASLCLAHAEASGCKVDPRFKKILE
ncbi:MAG TPA: tetratricopeptide repeat protein [Candidatus Kapabacteria bacterium]|nr:tetratricopeptide repeat protein [Candidatus Kapabacteria bacterium]